LPKITLLNNNYENEIPSNFKQNDYCFVPSDKKTETKPTWLNFNKNTKRNKKINKKKNTRKNKCK